MRIEKRFHKEKKQTLPAIQNDEHCLQRCVDHLVKNTKHAKRKNLEAGLCLSLAEYEATELTLFNLAKQLKLDMTSDILDKTGVITLCAPRLNITRNEEPEQIESFSSSLSSANHIFINAIPENDETLIQITLLFDLDL